MPVTLLHRLPLPNLKVYTAGSVLVLSMAVYHAIGVTSDPAWRVNATLQRQDALAAAAAGEGRMVPGPALGALDAANATTNLTEQFVDVMTYMMHEPLCMWTVINIAYCVLALFGLGVQRLVFGKLRVAEAQRVKDKFWNYVFYKFIFVFGVINVQYMDEVVLWCSWFTLVGFLHLMGQLCKDRFEYLVSSPQGRRWAHARLATLLTCILLSGGALMVVAVVWGLPAGRDIFAFMAAECLLVLVSALHVLARYALRLRDADAAGPLAYYTHLVFDSCLLVVELVHVVHMVVYGNMLVSTPALVLLLQLRHLLHELQARLARHRLYTQLRTHMSLHYPMASKEEMEKNQDNCAICWEPMKDARKLPCSHLFHNSCLCRWVQQDASCPTCRRTLSARPAPAAAPAPVGALPGAPAAAPAPPGPPTRPNHLFHFDGSRYVSWLPSFSVEVTRVRAAPPPPSMLDAMARQVQQMFPHYSVHTLIADLAMTRSPDLTVENILEGRLVPSIVEPLTTAVARADTPPPLFPPAAAPAPLSPAAPPVPAQRDAATSAPAPPPPAPSPTHRHHSTHTHSHVYVGRDDDLGRPSISSHFSSQASEREACLLRRKQQLIEAARSKYLDKCARHPTPHPSQHTS